MSKPSKPLQYNRRGKRRKPIVWEEFDKLCAMQCTREEIAAWFGISKQALIRACHTNFGMTFKELHAQKRMKGRISVRRKQFQLAMEGNPTMLIWLGKQYLGQRDNMELTSDPQRPLASVVQVYLPDNGRGAGPVSNALAPATIPAGLVGTVIEGE